MGAVTEPPPLRHAPWTALSYRFSHSLVFFMGVVRVGVARRPTLELSGVDVSLGLCLARDGVSTSRVGVALLLLNSALW